MTQVPAQRGLEGPWALPDAKSHKDNSRRPAPHSISESLGFEGATRGMAPCWNKTVTLEQSRQRGHAKPLAWQSFCPEGTKTSHSSQRIAGTQAGMTLWEPGAQLQQVERERQRHGQGRGGC